jgi:hypothetical protein
MLAVAYLAVLLVSYIYSGLNFLAWIDQSFSLETFLVVYAGQFLIWRKLNQGIIKVGDSEEAWNAHILDKGNRQDKIKSLKHSAIVLVIIILALLELLILGFHSKYIYVSLFGLSMALLSGGIAYYGLWRQGKV